MARISEGLGVLALAADAATGRPQGSGLSAAIVAAEFARRIGEDLKTQKDAYYLASVRFIGCTITSHEPGMLSIGDDLGFAIATILGDWADREDLKEHLKNISLPSGRLRKNVKRLSITYAIYFRMLRPISLPPIAAKHISWRKGCLCLKRSWKASPTTMPVGTG